MDSWWCFLSPPFSPLNNNKVFGVSLKLPHILRVSHRIVLEPGQSLRGQDEPAFPGSALHEADVADGQPALADDLQEKARRAQCAAQKRAVTLNTGSFASGWKSSESFSESNFSGKIVQRDISAEEQTERVDADQKHQIESEARDRQPQRKVKEEALKRLDSYCEPWQRGHTLRREGGTESHIDGVGGNISHCILGFIFQGWSTARETLWL